MSAWKGIQSRYLVYFSREDKENGNAQEIPVPYWKAQLPEYEDILTWTKLLIKDYPVEIGPYPCPETFVSFMDSLLQYVIICIYSLFYIKIYSNMHKYAQIYFIYIYI